MKPVPGAKKVGDHWSRGRPLLCLQVTLIWTGLNTKTLGHERLRGLVLCWISGALSVFSSRGPKTGSGAARPMERTSAMEWSGPEPQPDNGHPPRPWPCPQENRTSSLMALQPPRVWGTQLQGPSVLESKVRALKEKMTGGKQGVSPCPTSHEWSSPKKPKCTRGKAGGARTPSEGSFLPGAVMAPHTQNLPDGQLDSGVSVEEPARDGGPRPPRPPGPGREYCNWRSPWPPEAEWTLPDHERDPLLGPSSLQQSPIHGITPGQPGGPGLCNKIIHIPSPRTGRSYPFPDDVVTEGDLDSTSLTSEEDFAPRTALLGEPWRAGDLQALGAGSSALSLSDRVERNRLLLQEMLSVSGQSPHKAGTPAWTPSWDTAVPERPMGDVDWDSAISLQDSGQNRDGHRSPARDPRTTLACRDSLQNGHTSDSSSGESSGGPGPRPRRGPSPSHVRFEDESAREAECRYLERLQQRQRQVLSTVLQAVDQGPLRSKPDLADYINGPPRLRDAGQGAFHRLVGSLDRRGPLVAPTLGSERRCQACGSCINNLWPTQGKAAPDPRALQEPQAPRGMEGLLGGLSSPLRLLPAEPGLHTEWIRETHIGDTVCPAEVHSALDSTDTLDSCRTDSEEAGISQASQACEQTRGSSPRLRLQGSRPQGHRWPKKADTELPWGLQARQHLPGADDVELGNEVKEDRGHTAGGTLFLREDAVPKPPGLELKRVSLGPQWQPGPGLGSHQSHSLDSRTPCRTAYATTSPRAPESLGPGGQAQVIESHESLEIVSPSSLQQGPAEPSAPNQAQQPTASFCPEGWTPTPPPSRKTTSPTSHRKAALAGQRRPSDQGEPVGIPRPPSRSAVLRTCELSPSQTQPSCPQVRHSLLALSTNNCNNSAPRGLQEPCRGAVHEGRVERGPRSREPEPPLENSRDGGSQGFPSSADVDTINSTGITLSLFSEDPEFSQESEGSLQRTESGSGRHVLSKASAGAGTGPGCPSAAPSDQNKKRSSSIASTLGLKKLFSALSQSSRPKLGKSRSYSVEQLQPAVPRLVSHSRAPSLQSLHPVSPHHQRRKAASFQNLHSLLSGKGDRSSLYLVAGPGDHSAAGRLARASPRRALSVEDVGAPSLVRTVGRLVEVFPDGTSQLQLQRSPGGTFGFCVASGNGRPDSGIYVQEMADMSTAKLYSGLLGVGDEILEVNGAKVAGLGLAHIKELLACSESLSIRVLRQRPVPR
uniref:KIAA1614 n=1 Tax=Callithrix jacchus TaxID=9483 RepID=A0A8I3WCP9_CALJA